MNYPNPTTTSAETLSIAWEYIHQGTWGANSADNAESLTTARELLGQIESGPEEIDPNYALGQLALAHWPIFEAWGQQGTVGAEERTEVRSNLAELLQEIAPQGDYIVAGDMGLNAVARTAVAELFLLRRADTKHVPHPSPPWMQGMHVHGSHHLYVARPDGLQVPTRLIGQTGKHTPAVLALCIDYLFDKLAGRPAGAEGKLALRAFMNERIGSLVLESLNQPISNEERELLDLIGENIFKRVDEYHASTRP